jgi:putative addiction module killer protein
LIKVRQTPAFAAWLEELSDRQARARIIRRIDRLAETGSFGDVKPVGSGISEMRINFGPGYRLYCVQQGISVVILLCGGDKSSQKGSRGDIAKAKRLAADL